MIDLKSVLDQYPDAIDNRNKLKGILWDLYPEEKRDIFILMMLYEEDIVTEIRRKSLNIPARFSARLESDYGISSNHSLPMITLWQAALGYSQADSQSIIAVSPSMINTVFPDKERIKVGDVLKFGNYWHGIEKSEGKTPIEWQVLEVKDKSVLLISKYGIDVKPYDFDDESITWENCSLRNWLNKVFYRNAFNDDERNQITLVQLEPDRDQSNSSDDRNNTQDYIFPLSIQEAEYYFKNDDDRQCKLTTYAVWNEAYFSKKTKTGIWWLRSSGEEDSKAAFISDFGSINSAGDRVDCAINVVRPAFWLNVGKREKSPPIPVLQVPVIENVFIKQSVNTGDILKFGSYWQGKSKSNERTPIEWLVLEVKNNRALLISKLGLDVKPYGFEDEATTWEDCPLRNWLNGVFYRNAFSEEEKTQIAVSDLKAEKNPIYNTDAGKDTQDKIFLLSIQEAEQYFDNDKDRRCKVTAFAVSKGAFVFDDTKTGDWWLRSPGKDNCMAAYVDALGPIDGDGDEFDCGIYIVRPALWINL